MTPTKATWICVRCGYLNRCEVVKCSTEVTDITKCPPISCLEGLIVGDDINSDRSEWELVA